MSFYSERSLDRVPTSWLYGGFIALVALLFVRLGAADIYILDEAKNAQCAREMWERGDWIVPTFNGTLRTDKPALHYWFMMLAYQFFGFGYWQARLFSAVFGVVAVLLVFFFVKKNVGEKAGFFAALALAVSPHFLFEFRLSVPDPYLICLGTAGLLAGFEYVESGRWKWLFSCAALLALATLAKGPVALALPGLCLLLWVVSRRRWSIITNGRWVVGALLFAAISLPWYLAVHHATDGAFTEGFFLDHNLNRFSDEKEGHGAPFIVVPLMVMVGMLPFALWLIPALARKSGLWQVPVFRFAAVVTAVYVVFFSLSSTKLPNYPMPCYPFVAVLAGLWMHRQVQQNRAWPAWAFVVWMVLGLALAIGGLLALRAEKDVAGEALLALGLLVVTVLSFIGWRLRSQPAKAWSWPVLGWTLLAAWALWVAYPAVYRHNPATKAYAQLPHARDTTTQWIAYKAFNPAFLVQQPGRGAAITQVQSMDELRQLANQNTADPLYLITRKEFYEELKPLGWTVALEHRDLFELPTTLVLARPSLK